MAEIRPIEPTEADDFLAILCQVFSLDPGRARAIFFSEPLFDLRRKWALFEGGRQVSILTTIPLEFGWGQAIGIAGVATRPESRRKGLAAKLLAATVQASREAGEKAAFLLARETALYERCGFQTLDRVVSARLDGVEAGESPALPFEEVRSRYDCWSREHPDRLRRDERRWAYWRWNLRACTEVDGGYVCVEGNAVRECVLNEPLPEWPVGTQRQWFGLSSMAESLRAPIANPEPDLYLMGWNAPGVPQMFMTDQF